MERPLRKTVPGREADSADPCGVFDPGVRVVMRLRALRTLADATRSWAVVECRCDLCLTGRFVAIDQDVGEGLFRHVSKASVRAFGSPGLDEFAAVGVPCTVLGSAPRNTNA